jgi:y4mF family transcriptional regulator
MRKSRKTRLILFVKTRRKSLGLTQVELAKRAGVGLRFVRDLEQGKNDLRMDKVNDVLALFGHELGPVRSGEEAMSEQDASGAGE